MNHRILMLILFICIAGIPAMTASGDYMGGNIVLGGSGQKVTQVTTATVPVTTASVPPTVRVTTGSLSVTTSPPGATILIDGFQRGVSPATIPGLTSGSRTLLLKLDGYEDHSVPVTITAGQTLTYTAVLSPVQTPLPALPAATKKTPGFEACLGLAAIGAVLAAKKTSR